MLSNGHIKSELSPQDQELISLLQWAPRITWGEAAEILGAHATTLAGRWEKLERSGIAWITAQVNLRTPATSSASSRSRAIREAGLTWWTPSPRCPR